MSGIPLSFPELHWRLVGEAMADGRHLYLDIYDDMGPLAGYVYQVLFAFFGNARWPYYALSSMLVIIQAGFFNQMLLSNKAYKENTYVPALFYMVFMNMAFDFVTLPPVLFSITFILLATNNVFKRIDNTTRDELFLNTGLYLGIAVLFYLPLFPFLFTTLLSLLLFTGSIPRRILLLLFGFSLVVGLAYVYYFWFDGEGSFYSLFIASLWRIEKEFLVSAAGMWLISVAAVAVLLFSLFMIYSRARFANYQIKFQQVMVINIIASFITLSLSNQIVPHLLMLFAPSLAFFAAHFVLEIRRRFLAEITFALILIAICGWGYLIYFRAIVWSPVFIFSSYYVNMNVLPAEFHGKSLWVIGDDENYYSHASLGSPFLSWELSESELSDMQYYSNVEKIAHSIEKFKPEVIVDLMGFMPKIVTVMPLVGESYLKVSGTNYYVSKQP